MKLPIIQLDFVYHIGTLNRADRGKLHATSLEGHLISVSHCPEAWSRIARIGGPTQCLTKAGSKFLDIHALLDDRELYTQVVDWGVANNLLIETQLWRHWFFDGETEEWCYMTHPSMEEAINELDEEPEEEPRKTLLDNGHYLVEPYETLTGTPLLSKAINGLDLRVRDFAVDYAVILWVERNTSTLDGVWWREAFDPYGYSAPRGGIFPSRLKEWSAEQVADLDSTEDEMLLSAFPDTQVADVPIDN